MPTREQIGQQLMDGVIGEVQAYNLLMALIQSGQFDDPERQVRAFISAALAGRIEPGLLGNLGPEEVKARQQEFNISGTTVGGPGPGGDTGDILGALEGEVQPTRVSFDSAFDRFISTSPWSRAKGPALSAGRLQPLAELQFLLQPQVQGTPGGYTEFGDFLSGGKFLKDEGLSDRLSSLASSLYSTRINPEGQPIGRSLMNPLTQAFSQSFGGNLQNAFSAFTMPILQGSSGYGRDLLAQGYKRFADRFFAQNPDATPGDIAKLFGFQDPTSGFETPTTGA
jgi:hypothetical protein